MINCVTSGLAVFEPTTAEWTAKQVGHLYRSLGNGASFAQIQAGLQLTPSQLVDQLIDEGINTPLPAVPYWSEWTNADYDNAGNDDLYYEHYESLRNEWVTSGITNPFLHKMSMFWHDHFSTQKDVYGCNAYAWKYYYTLHEFAFGNFRTFVQNMGLTEAMLVFLDGNDNVVGGPNENYARELMELFTMGEGNGYTQNDIAEVAKALTGWRVSMYECEPAEYVPSRHDNSVKEIFGQSGNFDYDDVHELIFTLKQDEVANYICSKIYRHFIYDQYDEAVVNGLAETFKEAEWEIEPVIRQLFKSQHFFEQVLHGAKIKSPQDLLFQMVNNLGLDINTDLNENVANYFDYVSREIGQDIFEPPNVAGWPGHRFWISENSLTYRWSFTHIILDNYLLDPAFVKLRQLALDISPSQNDPRVIAEAVASHLISVELDSDLVDVATQYLKAGIPQNYFDDGSWNLYWDEAPEQIMNLIKYLVQIPEYQLS